jgi:hypothetical protein
MPYSYEYSKLRVDGVFTLAISDIQPDADTTQYVRLVQVYTDPPSSVNRRPVLEIAVYGGDQQVSDMTPIEITLPGGIEF